MAETTETTVIGRATLVRGRVSGMGDLEIAGYIEGEIACSGEALVDTSGLVAANINARRIVVRGAVKGDLVADEFVYIEAGAKVVGNLRAPRVAIAHGGLVRGQVQTTAPATPRPAARSTAASTSLRAPTTLTATTAATAPAPAAREARAAVPAQAKAPAASGAAPVVASRQASQTSQVGQIGGHAAQAAKDSKDSVSFGTLSGSRRAPPPPVVPVLKKGTKAIQKKR